MARLIKSSCKIFIAPKIRLFANVHCTASIAYQSVVRRHMPMPKCGDLELVSFGCYVYQRSRIGYFRTIMMSYPFMFIAWYCHNNSSTHFKSRDQSFPVLDIWYMMQIQHPANLIKHYLRPYPLLPGRLSPPGIPWIMIPLRAVVQTPLPELRRDHLQVIPLIPAIPYRGLKRSVIDIVYQKILDIQFRQGMSGLDGNPKFQLLVRQQKIGFKRIMLRTV